MAGKIPGRTTKKKPASARTKAKASTGTGKSYKSRSVKKNTKADKSPLYILAIMVLLTIVVFLLIMNYNAGNKKNTITKIETTDITDKRLSDANTEKNNTEKSTKKDVRKEIETQDNLKDKNKKDIVSENVESSQKDYNIYFLKFDSKNERMHVIPVKRQSGAASPLQNSLNELLKGPDRNERRNGILSAIPEDLKIRNIKIVGRNAVLDLNDAIEENANGEILLTRIDQLVYTATQFDGIDGVIIKINGKEKKFLGGEGLSISGPIRRRGK
jgi:spore germination protein GerM